MLLRKLLLMLMAALAGLASYAQSQIQTPRSFGELTRELKRLDRGHEALEVEAYGQSLEDRELWVAEAGAGDADARAKRPALLLVAGIEGSQPAGTEIALAFLEAYLQEAQDDEQALLEHITVYVIPRANPDAIENSLEAPVQTLTVNTTPYDQDNDRRMDEDGLSDLNDDGLITWLRVKDPEAQWIQHPDDSRILIKADAAEGETAVWRLLREGRDDDGDGEINEDPPGGTNLNQNFPFQYPWFASQAGRHSVSEPESRALADFLVEHPNIAVVLTYANQDNLLKTPKSGKRSGGGDPQSQIVDDDSHWFKHLGQMLRDELGLKKEVAVGGQTDHGTLANWNYFHRGRLGLTTLAWNPDIALALPDGEVQDDDQSEQDAENKTDAGGENEGDAENDESAEAEPSDSDEGDNVDESEDEDQEASSGEKRGRTELKYLQWIEEHAPGAFIDWQAVEHPGFPDQTAEVGGFAPYAKTLPPAQVLQETIIPKHVSFIKALVKKLPRIEISKAETEHLGRGVYRLTLRVINRGYLPTVLAHGERTGEVHATRIEFSLPNEAFLAGERITRIGPLSGSGASIERQYIIKPGSERFTVQVISALGGEAEVSFQLQGGEE